MGSDTGLADCRSSAVRLAAALTDLLAGFAGSPMMTYRLAPFVAGAAPASAAGAALAVTGRSGGVGEAADSGAGGQVHALVTTTHRAIAQLR